MKRSADWAFVSPSSTLLNFVTELMASEKAVALDVACGLGRNAIVSAAHGCNVVCVDRDLARLRQLEASKRALLRSAPVHTGVGQITTVCADLIPSRCPFSSLTFQIIISVHFVNQRLFSNFAASLCNGGHLYVETFGGQGNNYLELPRPGELLQILRREFDVRYYREKAVSARHPSAVSVKALARKI